MALNNGSGRIVVALDRQYADLLRKAVASGAGDIKTLKDAAVALGADLVPLTALLERPEFHAASAAIPNRTGSLRDLVTAESQDETRSRRTLVGVFSINASALAPEVRQQLVEALRALSPIVATAYEESSEAVVSSGQDSHIDEQTYLNAAPDGIGLKAPGVDNEPAGTGVGLAAIDKAWNLQHASLTQVNQQLDDGQGHDITESDRRHGTAALGLILSPPGKPIMGIAPDARLKALRAPAKNGADRATNPIADAINDATDELQAGDVLLIELQEIGLLPVEVNIDTWTAIERATKKGIVVIEPAGNAGGADGNLDNLARDKARAPAWNWPTDPDPDSGAVMVSGCTSVGGVHHPDPTCNQGDRVDCYAPSQHIETAGGVSLTNSWNDVYSSDFNGTSAASAIIAGVVLRMQALALQTHGIGGPLTPAQIRDLLRSAKLGTPVTSNGTKGYMPNLAKLPNVLQELAASMTAGPHVPQPDRGVPHP